MTTQEAQAFVQNWKGSKDDPKYLEAKAFLEGQDTRPWYEKDSHVAEDKIAEIEQKQRMTNPIEGASGNIARGNQGDNAIANPNALDTSDVTDVHQKELASVQTPENMNPGTFTTDNAIREEAEAKKAPKTAPTVQPQKGDTKKEENAKGRYNKSMMSIWDAYHNGLIDKETAGYFTVDALATLAKNLGRGIGNVGAQFSGGSIDQGHDESMWDKRKNEIFNTELQKESEGIDTFDNLLKSYQVDKAATVNDMLNDFRAKANDPTLSETERKGYQVLAVQLAGAGLDGNTQIASIGTGILDDLKSKWDEWLGKKGK